MPWPRRMVRTGSTAAKRCARRSMRTRACRQSGQTPRQKQHASNWACHRSGTLQGVVRSPSRPDSHLFDVQLHAGRAPPCSDPAEKWCARDVQYGAYCCACSSALWPAPGAPVRPHRRRHRWLGSPPPSFSRSK
eukprot:299093-Pleurochrysis_carterae.AAC.2